jgi:hypothetical protein
MLPINSNFLKKAAFMTNEEHGIQLKLRILQNAGRIGDEIKTG